MGRPKTSGGPQDRVVEKFEAPRPRTAPAAPGLEGHDFGGERALLDAVKAGDYDAAKAVLEEAAKGGPPADPKVCVPKGLSGRTKWSVRNHAIVTEEPVLYRAIEYGNIEMVTLLMKHAADSRQKLPNGHTPLAACAQYGRIEIAKVRVAARVEACVR